MEEKVKQWQLQLGQQAQVQTLQTQKKYKTSLVIDKLKVQWYKPLISLDPKP